MVRAIIFQSCLLVFFIFNFFSINDQEYVECYNDIDWAEVLKHFPDFTIETIRSRFRYIIQTRVPHRLKSDFHGMNIKDKN